MSRQRALAAVAGAAAVLVIASTVGLGWISLHYGFSATQNIAMVAAVATVLGAVGSVTTALLAFGAAGRSNDAAQQLAEIGERTVEALSKSYLHEFKIYVRLNLRSDGTAATSLVPFAGLWFGVAGRDYQRVVATAYGLDGEPVGSIGPLDFDVRTDSDLSGGLQQPDPWIRMSAEVPAGEMVDIGVAHRLLSHVDVEFDDQARLGRWRQRFELVFATPEYAPEPGQVITNADLRKMKPQFVGASSRTGPNP